MHTKRVSAPLANFYYFYHFSILSKKIGSIPFFLSFDKHKSDHLEGCHTTGIDSSLTDLFKCFTFFKFIMSSQKLQDHLRKNYYHHQG